MLPWILDPKILQGKIENYNKNFGLKYNSKDLLIILVLYTSRIPTKVHDLGANVLYTTKVPYKVHDPTKYMLAL